MAYRDENNRFAPSPVKDDQERTAAQNNGKARPGMRGGPVFAGSMLWANGGSVVNPMGFPGYGQLYTGTPENYRWILQHPIVQLVRSIAVGPIAASIWEYEKARPGTPDQDVQLIKDMFDPLRHDLLADFYVRGRDYGWASGEPIWETRERGLTWLSRVKPLAHEVTEIFEDKFGNFVGLRNHVAPSPGQPFTDLSAPFKAWKYTYDGECGYHYGRSWLENIRTTAWKDWLDAAQQMQKLGAKISGIHSVIISPSGSFLGPPDASGVPTQVSYQQNAIDAIKGLSEGAVGVWLPSIDLAIDQHGNVDAMRLLAELAGKSLTNFQLLDFGNTSPAIMGLLERMIHDEQLMFAGGLRPARSGLTAESSAKADAEIHTDTATQNSELDDSLFAKRLQPLVDAALWLNRGPGAVGGVRINPPSLVNRQISILKAFLLATLNDPNVAEAMLESADIDQIMKNLGIAMKTGFEAGAVAKVKERNNKAAAEAKQPRPGSTEPQGGRPRKEDE